MLLLLLWSHDDVVCSVDVVLAYVIEGVMEFVGSSNQKEWKSCQRGEEILTL